MFLEKYEPRSSAECIGNKKQTDEIKNFITNFKKGRAMILHGPTGCGKTLALKIVAAELGYEIITYSRLDTNIKSFLASLNQKSFFYKGKIVVIDLDSESERSMNELVKDSSQPVIFTSLNAYDYRIRNSSQIIKFSKINYISIAAFLRKICEAEKIKYDDSAVSKLARLCDGDIRSALIDLWVMNEITEESLQHFSHRNREENIFNTLKIIFKTTSIENVFSALESSDKDSSEILSWLHENLAEEYTDTSDLANAYEALSKADLFSARTFRRQAMSLKKYESIGIAGVSLAKKNRYNKFYVYKAPRFRKSETKAVTEKISSKLHISTKKSKSYIPLLRIMIKKNPAIADQFDFDEDDIDIMKKF